MPVSSRGLPDMVKPSALSIGDGELKGSSLRLKDESGSSGCGMWMRSGSSEPAQLVRRLVTRLGSSRAPGAGEVGVVANEGEIISIPEELLEIFFVCPSIHWMRVQVRRDRK